MLYKRVPVAIGTTMLKRHSKAGQTKIKPLNKKN